MPKKILLADDSVTIQKVVELTFAEGDYQVTCVSNGRAALDRLKVDRPDILLCDIIMPELSGYEVAEFVKKDPTYKGIPVILLTGTFEPFDEEKARLSGADTYITKPFDSRMLVEKVESLLQQRLVMEAAKLPDQPMVLLPGQGQSVTVAPPAPTDEAVKEMLGVPPPQPESPFAATPSAPMAAPFPVSAPPPPVPFPTPAGAFPEAATALSSPFAPEGSAFGATEASPFAVPEPPAPVSVAPAPGDLEVTEPAFSAPAVPAAEAPAPPEPAALAPPPAPAAPPVMDFGDFQAPAAEEALETALPPVPEPPAASPEALFAEEPKAQGWDSLAPEIPEVPVEPVGGQMLPDLSEESPAASEVVAEAPETGFGSAPAPESPQEPELPPFEEGESVAQIIAEPEAAAEAFTAQPGGEPELEGSGWNAPPPLPAEPVAPVEGLVHEMTDQQEMVAEAHEAAPELPEEPAPPAAPPAAVAVPVAGVAAVPEVDAAQVEAIVRKVVAEMAPDMLRQIAWEVIPELAESLIKRRIQELESQVE